MTTSSPKHLIRQAAAVVSALLLGALALAVPHSAGAADSPSTTVSVTGASAADGLQLHVTGTGFTDLPAGTAGPNQGVYVALRDPATMTDDAINADNGIVPDVKFIYKGTIVGGNLSTDLTAAAADLDPDADWEIIVWAAHGNITPDTLLTTTPVPLTDDQKQALFPDWTPPTTTPPTTTPPTGPWSTTATVTGATAADGLTVNISGTGFTGLPNASTGAPASGVYAALRDPATTTNDDINANPSNSPAFTFVPNALINAGAFSTTLTAAAADLDPDGTYEVIVWVAHGNITPATLLTTTPVPLTDDQKQALFPDWTPPTTTPPTTTPPTTTRPATTVPSTTKPSTSHHTTGTNDSGQYCVTETTDGSVGTPTMNWGVKSSFSNYIESNIAKGTITTGGGTVRSGSSFTWTNGSGSVNTSGQGTWSFPGWVHFTGHDGVLDTTFSNVRVRAEGSARGVLIADVVSSDMEGNNVGGASMTIANLRFSSISPKGGSATVSLTAQGARALNSMYDPGEAMDPLTVSVSGASAGSTVENCYDAQGNLISSTPIGGGTGASGSLAATGSDTAPLVGVGGTVAAIGALLLIAVALRRRADARIV